MDSEELILAFNLYLKLPFVKMNKETLENVEKIIFSLDSDFATFLTN
jgi:hypothetical protein